MTTLVHRQGISVSWQAGQNAHVCSHRTLPSRAVKPHRVQVDAIQITSLKTRHAARSAHVTACTDKSWRVIIFYVRHASSCSRCHRPFISWSLSFRVYAFDTISEVRTPQPHFFLPPLPNASLRAHCTNWTAVKPQFAPTAISSCCILRAADALHGQATVGCAV
jgi:hypothetical protein